MSRLREYRVRLRSGLVTTLRLSEEHRARDFPDAVPVDKVVTAPRRKQRRSENKSHEPEDK